MKKILKFIPTIIVVFVSGTFLYLNRSELEILSNVRFIDIGLLVFLISIFYFLTGFTFKLVVNLLNVELDAFETFGLSILTNFGNYLAPTSPGSVIKATYLKSAKGLEYAKFTSVFTLNNFLGIFTTGCAGGVMYLILKLQTMNPPTVLLWVSLALILGSILPFALKIPKLKIKGSITEILSRALEGFETMRTQRVKLLFICGSYLLQFLVGALVYKYSFQAIGVSIPFFMGLVIAVFTTMGNFLTVTPSNIGVQEAISAYIFTISGYDFTTGVIGAALIRVVHLVIAFSLASVFMHFLFKSEDLKRAKFW